MLRALSNELRVNVNNELRQLIPLIANVASDINVNYNYVCLLLNGISFSNSINMNISYDEFSQFHVSLYSVVSKFVFSTKRLLPLSDAQ